jgi:plasmid stabilization system protein ParE
MLDKVVWSQHALEDLEIIIDYLLSNWGSKTATEFIDMLETHLKYIEQ